jgi:4-amino-4-deoxy-L-arabinose transferase-like glycosyltransferase
MDQELHSRALARGAGRARAQKAEWWALGIVLLLAALIYVPTLFTPHLMDDTDAVNAQIPRNMIQSGDWVTARLNGVAFLEKSPMMYWLIGGAYRILGEFDWVARVPTVLSILLIAGLIYRMGRWAFGVSAGQYSALMLTTCAGLFLFTRILIPDVMVTGTIALALWAMLRTLDPDESHPRLWSITMAAAMGVGVLLKGVISLLFPIAAGLIFLGLTGALIQPETWRRLRPFQGAAIILAITAPWFVFATLANPPYFDFSMQSGPGQYRGFFWFYFFNEHILRFLNQRWPRDYDTVPRYLFWTLHLVWFFPWSAYLPALAKLQYRGYDRASRMRLLCLCWAGFVMVFFTFSTTQEYYSMPAYPAIALLLGCAMAEDPAWIRRGARVTSGVAFAALTIILLILWNVWSLPTPGDISNALTSNPGLYTLSLGHMGDLTLASFAYLREPLVLAGIAFLIGAIAAARYRGYATHFGLALMMVLFLNAARVAMGAFDPYLSSQPLAAALRQAPPGHVVLGDQYYTFSSVFFYGDVRDGLLLNGRYQNLEYGSYAPGAPNVFLNDAQLGPLWRSAERAYLILEGPKVNGIEQLLGKENLHLVRASGGKFLFSNQPLPGKVEVSVDVTDSDSEVTE